MTAPRVLLYSEVNFNLIDGSAIWAQSLCQVLSAAGADLTLLLRAPVTTERLLEPIEALPGVRVVRAVEEGLAPAPHLTLETAPQVMADLDRDRRFDVVLVRGLRLCARIAASGQFDGRLWAYVTDLNVERPSAREVTLMRQILGAASILLIQTEWMRSAVSARFPECADRVRIWQPVLPPGLHPRPNPEPLADRPVRLGYTGKFIADFCTLEMTRLPRQLGERGIDAEVHMVGDKFHESEPGYTDRMRAALTDTPGVVWHGGVSRAEALDITAAMDFGLNWRTSVHDDGMEISTKLLECSAMGVPPLLNPTVAHRAHFGDDYPFYVDSEGSIVEAVRRGVSDPALLAAARARSIAATEAFGFAPAVQRMTGLLLEAVPSWLPEGPAERRPAPRRWWRRPRRRPI